MENQMIDQGKELYPVCCTFCGERIHGTGASDTKVFPIGNILENYHCGVENKEDVRKIISTLNIQVSYGSTILPQVPPLFSEKKLVPCPASTIDKAMKQGELRTFSCQNNEIPLAQLQPVNLTMAAIVAQFVIDTGFSDIYKILSMLDCDISNMNDDDRQALYMLYDRFLAVPGVRLFSAVASNAQKRRDELGNIFQELLKDARHESELMENGSRNMAVGQIYVGWRYKVENGRNMPFSLVYYREGDSKGVSEIEDCRCPHCFRGVSYRMGAYRQKVVGILGTQATGKTTYMAALTDMIQGGKALSQIDDQGTIRTCRLTLTPEVDEQWQRVTRKPVPTAKKSAVAAGRKASGAAEGKPAEGSGKPGALWLYQNGFPPAKTSTVGKNASALTFLAADSGNTGREPVMYTLADIPGESFFDADHVDDQNTKAEYRLLYSCDALLMVISARQLLDQCISGEKPKTESAYIRSPVDILKAYESFLPEKAVPTAVVLTSGDELEKILGMNLRQILHLAYDVRRCRPLVWSEEHSGLVYNAQVMAATVKGTWDLLNDKFGMFTDNLCGIFRQKSGQKTLPLAAFVVSNGTQNAQKTYEDVKDDQSDTDSERQLRYQKMCAERFGVQNPLLWLLATENLLPAGMANSAGHREWVKKNMENWCRKSLLKH